MLEWQDERAGRVLTDTREVPSRNKHLYKDAADAFAGRTVAHSDFSARVDQSHTETRQSTVSHRNRLHGDLWSVPYGGEQERVVLTSDRRLLKSQGVDAIHAAARDGDLEKLQKILAMGVDKAWLA